MGISYIIEDNSCLMCCISIKLSQIVYLIYTHILIYQHAKCDHKLRKVPWIISPSNFHKFVGKEVSSIQLHIIKVCRLQRIKVNLCYLNNWKKMSQKPPNPVQRGNSPYKYEKNEIKWPFDFDWIVKLIRKVFIKAFSAIILKHWSL